jgi:3-hydroxy acid dehydrogenase/malonic semialdehyde reductase
MTNAKIFKGKTVLITGASSGFGEETARQFAQQGANLILIARREEKLKKLAQELKGTVCHIIVADVRNFSELSEKLQNLNQLGIPDILINNAGLSKGLSKVWESEPEEWDEVLDTNVKGVLNVTKLVLPLMLQKNRGQVINVGSVSGHDVYPGGGVYCASKFAIRAITDSLRMELIDTPLRVSLISPGLAKTEFSRVRFNGDEQKAEKVYEGVVPLSAGDIAETILFIAARPAHVNIADIILYPKCQASTMQIHRQQG